VVDRTLFPFESKYFDRGGLKLHYVDEGAGDPVVMVHGNPTWSFYFRGLIKALSPTHRCIALDHIGCGLSGKPPLERYPYRLVNRVLDLEALLDSLGVNERVTLVLHDWGGMIGMAMAHRRPERIARIVALNTAAFGLPEGKSFPRSLHWARNTVIGRWLVVRANAFCRGAARWCATRKPLSPELREAYLAPYGTPADRIAVMRFVEDIPLEPTHPSFALVEEVSRGLAQFRDRPILLGWGERDFVFDAAFRDEWKRRFPEAEVHSWSDSGHYILEDRGEELAELIKDFLTKSADQKQAVVGAAS
jgi:cis-3-alkyl-4-acyloxetan-2-one decarboxylase